MRLSELHTLLDPSVKLHHPGQLDSAGESGRGEHSDEAAFDGDVELLAACFDSRHLRVGDIFCALPGSSCDGREFIAAAENAGAAALLLPAPAVSSKLPQLIVPPSVDFATLAGNAASLLCGQPSSGLWTTAVTGTNGKSTVVHLLSQANDALGTPCARVGTLGMEFRGDCQSIPNTTPAADVLQAWLRDVVAAGARALAIEASSHGLHQQRLAGLEIDVLGWTNLSHDHLDYHQDMAEYAAAKALGVHAMTALGTAFIPYQQQLIANACEGARAQLLNWGLEQANAAVRAQFTTTEYGIELAIDGHLGAARLRSPLVGRHNGENLLLSWCLLRAQGVGGKEAALALEQSNAVPGRLQRVAPSSPWLLYVDYAHTPEALRMVLAALRETHPGRRLGVVFGAGGDRDREKRASMGQAAAEGADWCLVTSDNPRTEDPQAIVEAVAVGARSVSPVMCEIDRRQAIRQAVSLLNPGEVLLIAGKGHENYQEINGKRSFFDDCIELEEAVQCMA